MDKDAFQDWLEQINTQDFIQLAEAWAGNPEEPFHSWLTRYYAGNLAAEMEARMER
jgi:hypothetical protein